MREIMFIIRANEGILEKKVSTFKIGQESEPKNSTVGTYSYVFSDNILLTEEHKTVDGICPLKSMECFWKTAVNIHAHKPQVY